MPLLLALLLEAADGCTEATLAANSLSAEALARQAPALVERLAAEGAPADALLSDLSRARGLEGPAQSAAVARLRASLLRHCALAERPRFARKTEAERMLAAEILERPEFRGARADPMRVREKLKQLFQRLLALLDTPEAERYAGFGRAVFLLAASAAAFLFLLSLRRGRPSRPGLPPPLAEAREAAPDKGLENARAAAARGDGRETVRLSLLAALAALERAGKIPLGRALTNRELVRLLSKPGGADAQPLAVLTHLFDRAIYGGRPTLDAEAKTALEAAKALCAGGEA